ncbi:MAG: hypothetical protein CL763_07215 [Chloroflexi bacterium]|nr:hypothetical protein [Chloroflexota bacterium]
MNSMNYKILFIVISIILIVSLLFYFSMELYIQVYSTDWFGIINSQANMEDKNKIFLIGSSNLYAIDTNKINDRLSTTNYLVYNLADMSDNPDRRLNSIDNIISNKPKLVLYGIGIWEFQKFEESYNNNTSLDFLLNPKSFFTYLFENSTQSSINEIVASSPKDRMLTLLKYIVFGPDQHFHPFIKFKETPINDLNTIREIYGLPNSRGLDVSDFNKQVVALQKIIKKLEKNNIEVKLFSIPQHKDVLESLTESEILSFEDMLIKNSTSDVYFLHEKYSEMNIWRESFHIAVHPDASIYTDDVHQIILKEIKE